MILTNLSKEKKNQYKYYRQITDRTDYSDYGPEKVLGQRKLKTKTKRHIPNMKGQIVQNI